MTRPWPPGSSTGIGSLPGTDPDEAAALVFGELSDFVHLPELPERGPGAEMIGRTAALLVDLPVEIVPTGWRTTTHGGRDLRRARDLLARDLDALERQGAGYRGAMKLQATGPWTLAASVELGTGHKLVSDYGAVRDLAASLAEGLHAHLADVSVRVPGASLVLQLDEPSLPAVLAGQVPTPSGYGTVRAVAAGVAEQTLRDVLAVAPHGGRAVHCCAADAPVALLRGAGADAVAVDLEAIGTTRLDALGELIEDGGSLWAGVLPGTDAAIDLDMAREPILRLWSTLGFPASQLAEFVVPTPTCGLAGASPAYVRRVLAVLGDVGSALRDLS